MKIAFKVREKLIAITAGTILLSIGLNTYWNINAFIRTYKETVVERVFLQLQPLQKTINDLVELGLGLDELEGIDRECQSMVTSVPYARHCVVIDNEDQVYYRDASGKRGTACEDAVTRRALESNKRLAQSYTSDDGEHVYDFSLPITKPTGERMGLIRLQVQSGIVDEQVSRLIGRAATTAVVFAFAAGVIVFLLAKYSILGSIRQLMQGIARFGGGQLDSRVNVRTRDEIGELAQSFNGMAESILGYIAERKKTEERLTQLLSLHSATVEATADGILVVDVNGRVVSHNRKFLQLWHIPEDIAATEEDDRLLAHVLDQLENPEGFLAEVRRLYSCPDEQSSDLLSFKDGRVFERFSQPHKVNGKIVGRVWSFRDITERVRAEERQTHLLGQLEKTNQELKDFAYIVSHDLKAPLRGIKTLAGWISADCADKLGDDGKEQLSLLLSRADRMHDLIEGILQYSRIGRVKEEMVQVDLNELVPAIVDMLAPPENITITIQDHLPMILCEPTKTGQVFQNLLSNAVKYMDKSQGQITVGCVDEGGFWRFSVTDNGPGIEEEYFEKIFQMFQTLVPRDTFESTGVGLALVKKIVETFGGAIWVESEVGRGSTFFFTLPRMREKMSHEELQTCTAC